MSSKFDFKTKLIAGSFFVFSFLFFSVSDSYAVVFTRKPMLQNITTNSAEIRWVTDTHEQLVVKYGTSTSYGSQVNSDTVTGTGGPHNHARMTGLAPNTKYFYQITTAGGAALTPAADQTYYINTAPPTGSTTPFKFAIWGDSGSGGTVNKEELALHKPNLTMVAGDIVYDYSTSFTNNNSGYFDVYQTISRFSPFYVVCGNHDNSACGTVMQDHTLPGGGNMGGPNTTYSFDWGNVHFVGLNSNGSFAFNATTPTSSDPQMRWAYNDLRASTQPWKVLFFHHSGWSAGSHSTSQNIVDNFVKMGEAAGADLVIWGHSHVYERWNRKPGFYPGTQVYTIGNGGQRSTTACTSTSPGPGCAAKNAVSEAGFLLAEVNGNSMTVKYINQNGANPDTIIMQSNGPGPTGNVTNGPTATRVPTQGPTATRVPTQGPTATRVVTPTGGLKPGDANRDGFVDVLDFQLLSNSFGKVPGQTGYNANTNFNGDGSVDILDFQILSNNFGR